jgi:hypothetical protein
MLYINKEQLLPNVHFFKTAEVNIIFFMQIA